MLIRILVITSLTLSLISCSDSCDANQASNKLLALGRVQSRMVAEGGQFGSAVAARVAIESAPISELIAQKKFGEACKMADELAKRMDINLDNEMKGMLTAEQLAKDGGKGSGTCSIADAAKKQMDLHALLQAEVDAGRKSSDIFRQFNEDTVTYAEKLTRNPTEACELLDNLKGKYGL